VQGRLEKSPGVRQLAQSAWRDPFGTVDRLYLAFLARYPTTDEAVDAVAYIVAEGRSAREAVTDLAWALLNSKEFLYRH
jgi:hypothetical protein